MSAKTFFDANVLIYAHDVDAHRKHDIAKEPLMELWRDRTGILSMQVLHEFYVNVTRKISKPLPKPSARRLIGGYALWCTDTGPSEISAAFRIEDAAPPFARP